MKVTVCFGPVKVIVPCGDGDIPVKDLIRQAVNRYKKATGKAGDSWVRVQCLQIERDGGILDPDDRLNDVADDREKIVARFEEGHGPRADGASANSSIGSGSPDIFHNVGGGEGNERFPTDIEVTNQVISSAPSLQVRRGSEPALNQLLPPTSNGVGEVVGNDAASKRWSAAPLITTEIRDRPVGRKDDCRNGYYRGDKWSTHIEEEEIYRPNNFSRHNANRLSMQTFNDRGYQWWEAAEKAALENRMQSLSLPRETKRREPLGQATSANEEEIVVECCEGAMLGLHVVPHYDSLGRELGLLVQGVEPGGRIDTDGRIAVNDIIVSINGNNLINKPFPLVQEIFRDSLRGTELRLKVVKARGNKKVTGNSLFPPVVPPHSYLGPTTEHRAQPATIDPDTDRPPVGIEVGGMGSLNRRGVGGIMIANTRRLGRKLDITLVKGQFGLGFSLTTRDNPASGNCPIYIKNILPKGAAVEDGRLRPGDRLLAVDGVEVTGKSQGDVVAILRTLPPGNTVSLLVSRHDDNNNNQQEQVMMVGDSMRIEPPPPVAVPTPPGKVTIATPTKKEIPINNHYSKHNGLGEMKENRDTEDDSSCVYPWRQREILTLDIPVHDTEKAGLGVSVKGKTSSSNNSGANATGTSVDLGIFVKNVINGGAASRDGRLRTNDQLLSVNGVSLLGQSNTVAMETLRRALLRVDGPVPGHITLSVARKLQSNSTRSDSVSSLLTDSSANTETFGVGGKADENNTTGPSIESITSDNSDSTVIFMPPPDNVKGLERIGQTPPQVPNSLRNESYYRATHQTTMMLNGKMNPNQITILEDEPLYSPQRFRQTSEGEKLNDEPQHPQHRGSTSSTQTTGDVTYASQLSLDHDGAGFSRDAFGRQSMSEKRHAALDAKNTDTYQRNKAARKQRDSSIKDPNNSDKVDAYKKKELGPSLGMKKSSSLESLQTMVQEMQLAEDGGRGGSNGGVGRVIRGRGCNESFRAAVDRLAPLGTVTEDDDIGRQGHSASSPDHNQRSSGKAKKRQSLLKGIGSMFRFGNKRKEVGSSGGGVAPVNSNNSPSDEEREAARRAAKEEQNRIQEQYRRLMIQQYNLQQQEESEEGYKRRGGGGGGGGGGGVANYQWDHTPKGGGMVVDPAGAPVGMGSRSERINELRAEHQRRHLERRGIYPLDEAQERYDHLIKQQRLESGYENRPGSRLGITGSGSDRFSHYVNYHEIQQHLNRRQQVYHSQRSAPRESAHRPVSNFYEYESVQAMLRAHATAPVDPNSNSLPRHNSHYIHTNVLNNPVGKNNVNTGRERYTYYSSGGSVAQVNNHNGYGPTSLYSERKPHGPFVTHVTVNETNQHKP